MKNYGPITIEYRIEPHGTQWRVMRYLTGPAGTVVQTQRGGLYPEADMALDAAEGLTLHMHRQLGLRARELEMFEP